MRYLHLVVACALLLIFSVGRADNPEPSAILTWDLYDVVENLEFIPDDPVVLYITLFAAPEIETVSFETVWSPWSAGGGCYEMISCGLTGACGWMEGSGAQRLSDDIEATHTLRFKEPPGNGSCIRLTFTSNGVETDRRGTFCLRNFKITDLRGKESYLQTPNTATILGGIDLQLPQYITGIEPPKIKAGTGTRLRVLGGHFSKPVKLYLAKVGERKFLALEINKITPAGISCFASPGPDDTGRWILKAKNGDGFETVSPETLTVVPPGSGQSDLAGAEAVTLSLRCSPNPSRGWTDVSFALPKAGQVKVLIHDPAGRLVRRLLDGNGRCGINSIRWDNRTAGGDEVSAGVYLVSVEFGGAQTTEKLTIAR